MSVKIMSAVFDAQIPDQEYTPSKGKPQTVKSSTLKLILLALSDHASDTGESVYPSIEYLRNKTSIGSNSTVVAAIGALEKLGILTQVGTKSSGTKEYRITASVISNYIHCNPSITATVNESSLNHQEPIKQDKPANPRSKKYKEPYNLEIVPFIGEVCCLDHTNGSKRVCFEAADKLRKCSNPPTPAQIRATYTAGGPWYKKTWQGQKGQRPTPALVAEQWPFLSGAIQPPEAATDTREVYA
jgi:hypothetical protein